MLHGVEGLIPADEGPALAHRILRSGSRVPIAHALRRKHRAVPVDEGNGVQRAVRGRVDNDGHVGSDVQTVPGLTVHREGIVQVFGGIDRQLAVLAVKDLGRSRIHACEGDGADRPRPCRVDGHIGLHTGEVRIPAGEGVTLDCRGLRRGCRASERHELGFEHVSVTVGKDDCEFHGLIDRADGHITGDVRKIRIPAGEGIAVVLRRVRRGRFPAEHDLLHGEFFIPDRIEEDDRIYVNIDADRDRHVRSDIRSVPRFAVHGEGEMQARGAVYRQHSVAAVRDLVRAGVRAGIGDMHRRELILRRDGQIFGHAIEIRIPTDEGVPFPHGIIRSGSRRAVLDLLLGEHRAVPIDEGHGMERIAEAGDYHRLIRIVNREFLVLRNQFSGRGVPAGEACAVVCIGVNR